MAKRVYDLGMEVRPTRVWKNGVNEALNKRGRTLQQARVTVHYRMELRGPVIGV